MVERVGQYDGDDEEDEEDEEGEDGMDAEEKATLDMLEQYRDKLNSGIVEEEESDDYSSTDSEAVTVDVTE
jgi:hypothetical protein